MSKLDSSKEFEAEVRNVASYNGTLEPPDTEPLITEAEVQRILAAHHKATRERAREAKLWAEYNILGIARTWMTDNPAADAKWHDMLKEAMEETGGQIKEITRGMK